MLLLLLVAVLFLISTSFEGQFWRGLRAFCEAALVGGFADWFAVTALFRHPLGLPIPHTAIIPKNKDRIALNFGSFIERNFLSRELIEAKLGSFDVSYKIAGWLSQEKNALLLVQRGRDVIPPVIEILSEKEISDAVFEGLREQLRSINLSPAIGKVLKMIFASERHVLLTNELINIAGQLIEDNRLFVRQRVREETPWFVPDFIDNKIYEKIVSEVQSLVVQIKNDPQHTMRKQAADKLLFFIEKLHTDANFQAIGEDIKKEILDSPALRETFLGIISELKSAFCGRGVQPTGETEMRLSRLIVRIAQTIEANHVLKAKINRWLQQGIVTVVEEHRNDIAAFIAETVRGWNTSTLVDKFELEIGRDLQFIRINGTLVGGAIGLLLFFLNG